MGKHLHLFRRGSVYYWRRRIPGFSTGNAMIQLSLRTAARGEAYILSRKLTAESDRMSDALTRSLISVEDARKWLSHVVTEELARIRRVDLVTRMDPLGRAEEDARADWAIATAWKLMAEFGPRAGFGQPVIDRLTGAGATDADLAALERCLGMLNRDMLSEARMNRIASDFRGLTGGKGRPGAMELLQLRRWLIEGRAAAWAQRGELAAAEAEIAPALARDLAAGIASAQRQAWFGRPEAVSAGPMPVSGAATAEADPEAPAIRPEVSPNGAATSFPAPVPSAAPPVAHPVAAPEGFDPSLLATVARLNEARLLQRRTERGKEKVPETMEKLRLATAHLFIALTGIADVRQIRQADVSRFRDSLQKLPKSWGKSRKEASKPLAQVLEQALKQAAGLPPGRVGLAVPTVNRHLDVLRLILERAGEDGIDIDPKVQPRKLRLREAKRSRDKRAGFAEGDLAALFRHGIWTGCRGLRARNVPGRRIIRDGLYWVPLIAAYTGARREEIAGLETADIREEDGIACFDIRENANRGVKTLAGERRIPVHDRLIALGFLDHVAAMRRRKSSDLFPELRPNGHVKDGETKFGTAIYHAFSKALERVFDGNPKGFVMHSFRHYVNDRLSRETAIPKLVRIELIGHEGEGTNERVYVEPSPLRELQAAINALPVVDGLTGG